MYLRARTPIYITLDRSVTNRWRRRWWRGYMDLVTNWAHLDQGRRHPASATDEGRGGETGRRRRLRRAADDRHGTVGDLAPPPPPHLIGPRRLRRRWGCGKRPPPSPPLRPSRPVDLDADGRGRRGRRRPALTATDPAAAVVPRTERQDIIDAVRHSRNWAVGPTDRPTDRCRRPARRESIGDGRGL